LLSVCFTPIVQALLLWVPVFVGSVLLLGIGLFRFGQSRIRTAVADGSGPFPRSRVWAVRLTLVLTQIVLLPLLALVMAVPFALEQGAARTIESASTKVLDWGMRTGTDALKEKFQIVDDTAIVDLARVAPVLRSIPPAATRARGFLGVLSAVPKLATNAYFSAINTVVERAAEANLRLTWNDVFRSARTQFEAIWGVHARVIATFLRVSSLHFLQILAVTVAIVDPACILLILWMTGRRSGSPSS
jgi:hypothetical protein